MNEITNLYYNQTETALNATASVLTRISGFENILKLYADKIAVLVNDIYPNTTKWPYNMTKLEKAPCFGNVSATILSKPLWDTLM